MIVHCDIHNIDYENTLGNGLFSFTLPCPRCEEERGKQEQERLAEEDKKLILKKYSQMNIEPEFYNATLESFVAETDEQKKALTATEQLIAGEINKLVFLGKNGTGKTHLAIAAVKELNGAIYTMYEISLRIRATFTPSTQEREKDIIDELTHLPLLVIDEIGRSKASDSELNTLSFIIDKRHQRKLPSILISNKHQYRNCPNGGCTDCFDNYIGEDIQSRLAQNGFLLQLSGEDWRKSHRRTRPTSSHFLPQNSK